MIGRVPIPEPLIIHVTTGEMNFCTNHVLRHVIQGEL